MNFILQKWICQDCMGTICPVNGHILRIGGVRVRSSNPVPWQEGDDELWNIGKVLCPEATKVVSFREARNLCNQIRCHEAAENGALVVKEER